MTLSFQLMTNVAWLIGWIIRSPSLVAKRSPSILSAARADGGLTPTSHTSGNNAVRTSGLDGLTNNLFWRITKLSFDCRDLRYDSVSAATNHHLWRIESTGIR